MILLVGKIGNLKDPFKNEAIVKWEQIYNDFDSKLPNLKDSLENGLKESKEQILDTLKDLLQT